MDITYDKLKRDLPSGSEVEITLKISESRIITTNVYIPLLDEEFEVTLDLRKSSAKPEEIKKEFKQEVQRLQDLQDKADEGNDNKTSQSLEKIESSDLVAEIKDAVSVSEGDPDAAEKAERRLLELKLKLDKIENDVKWPSLVNEVNESLDDLDRLAKEVGDADHQKRAERLKAEIEDIIEGKDYDRLTRKQQQIFDLRFQIVAAQPSFWVGMFQNLEKQKSGMTDQQKANDLLNRGCRYLDENNVNGLRQVVGELWTLLPKRVEEEMKRAYGANLLR